LETSTWILWAGLLIMQNFSFTLVSRARNSGSYAWHAVAAVGSNGVWIVSQMILVVGIVRLMEDGTRLQQFGLAFFYITFTVIGSIVGHWVSKNLIERGRRKVGA
jgi:hypothetical protein